MGRIGGLAALGAGRSWQLCLLVTGMCARELAKALRLVSMSNIYLFILVLTLVSAFFVNGWSTRFSLAIRWLYHSQCSGSFLIDGLHDVWYASACLI